MPTIDAFIVVLFSTKTWLKPLNLVHYKIMKGKTFTRPYVDGSFFPLFVYREPMAHREITWEAMGVTDALLP